MRIIDAIRVFPTIIIALVVVTATGQSLINVVIVFGVLDSPVFVRLVRAEVLQLRSSTFVEAAVATGNPVRRILFVHLLFNADQGRYWREVPLRAAWAVRILATLAFFGIGIQAPTPEWGAMIRQGAEYMATGQWWVGVFPGGCPHPARAWAQPAGRRVAGSARPSTNGQEAVTLLQVRDLHTHFISRDLDDRLRVARALNGISFDLDEGEVLGLVGETGAGKSLTALSIMGLLRPPAQIVRGTILFAGRGPRRVVH